MQANHFTKGQAQAHPEFIKALVHASENYSIVASQDIVDVRGLKLWAKGQPVSTTLQQRLLERKLLHPIEACLMAEDGVTIVHVVEQLDAFYGSETSLARALRPWALDVIKQARQLPLHSVAQLMLTTMMATRPQTLSHAVSALALAATLELGQAGSNDLRLAMLGALLHDIGETYIQPQYLDSQSPLDVVGYKHMMVHPRLAQMLLATTTDYPVALSRAVGEHHERLNGAGYPARLCDGQISPLGALLCVTETTLGVASAGDPSTAMARASFALRVLPGEYTSRYVAGVFNLARSVGERPPQRTAAPQEALSAINRHLQTVQGYAEALLRALTGKSSDQIHIVRLALDRIHRLRIAWNAMGIWGLQAGQLSEMDQFELSMAESELRMRLRALQRECLMMAEQLDAARRDFLSPLWQDL